MAWLSSLFGGGKARLDVVLSPEQQQELSDWQTLPAVDLEMEHASTRYVIVDVETSGLNMKKDHLISIGAVALVDGRMSFKDTFQVVLRQDQVSAHENILIHGIGGSAQIEGAEPAEALLAFLRYVGKAPLVAYHAFFDQSMIDKALREYLGIELGLAWIDLAWVLPDIFQHRMVAQASLDAWLELFDIENIMRHNAVSDSYATAKLLQVVLARAVQIGAESPRSLQKIEKARRQIYENR